MTRDISRPRGLPRIIAGCMAQAQFKHSCLISCAFDDAGNVASCLENKIPYKFVKHNQAPFEPINVREAMFKQGKE